MGGGGRGEIRAPLENQCSQDVALGKLPHAYTLQFIFSRTFCKTHKLHSHLVVYDIGDD